MGTAGAAIAAFDRGNGRADVSRSDGHRWNCRVRASGRAGDHGHPSQQTCDRQAHTRRRTFAEHWQRNRRIDLCPSPELVFPVNARPAILSMKEAKGSTAALACDSDASRAARSTIPLEELRHATSQSIFRSLNVSWRSGHYGPRLRHWRSPALHTARTRRSLVFRNRSAAAEWIECPRACTHARIHTGSLDRKHDAWTTCGRGMHQSLSLLAPVPYQHRKKSDGFRPRPSCRSSKENAFEGWPECLRDGRSTRFLRPKPFHAYFSTCDRVVARQIFAHAARLP